MKNKKLEDLAKEYNIPLDEVLFIYHITEYKMDLKYIKQDNSVDAYLVTNRYLRRCNL